MSVGLPGGTTGKSRTDGDRGQVKSFSEKPGYGASFKDGPNSSHPGPGNGSGSIKQGPALTPKSNMYGGS